MTQADRFSEEEVSTGFVGCRSVLLRVFLGVQPNTLNSHPHPDHSSLDAEMVSPLTPWIKTRRMGWLWVPGLWPGLCALHRAASSCTLTSLDDPLLWLPFGPGPG